jgi:cytochrome c biogenesis protein CcmG/thiol:disulfide interchange protein DsbE
VTSRRLLALLAGLALLAACGSELPSDTSPSRPPGTIPADNATEAPLLPEFADALPTMGPDTFQRLLDQLRGTPVLVNVWGSWCPPCREEMPRLVAAHDEIGDRVQFLGIDIQDSRVEAKAFMEEFGMTFPSVFDVPDVIKTSLGQFGQPTTVFFRADGSFEFAYAGPISEQTLRRHLEEIARSD